MRVGHLYRSATEAAWVGGDFYDVFGAKDGNIAVLMGDVAGHGIEAARTSTLVKDVVHAFTHQSLRTHEVLRRTNLLLIEKGLTGVRHAVLGHPRPGHRLTALLLGGPPESMVGGSRARSSGWAPARPRWASTPTLPGSPHGHNGARRCAAALHRRGHGGPAGFGAVRRAATGAHPEPASASPPAGCPIWCSTRCCIFVAVPSGTTWPCSPGADRAPRTFRPDGPTPQQWLCLTYAGDGTHTGSGASLRKGPDGDLVDYTREHTGAAGDGGHRHGDGPAVRDRLRNIPRAFDAPGARSQRMPVPRQRGPQRVAPGGPAAGRSRPISAWWEPTAISCACSRSWR